MIAGIIGGLSEPHTFGYIVIDLEEQTGRFVHTFSPIPTDAGLDWGIHWSPDGAWLALDPPTFDSIEAGVWVIDVEANRKEFLGPGTDNPMWLANSGEMHLLYNAIIDGEMRMQQYDPVTGERFRLDVPAGAIPMQVAMSDS
jgi:hypothetical protein